MLCNISLALSLPALITVSLFLRFLFLSCFCFTLSHSNTHIKRGFMRMHISLCPDRSAPLYLPLRLGATRLIHLQGSRGNRGATTGTNMGRKKRGKRGSKLWSCDVSFSVI